MPSSNGKKETPEPPPPDPDSSEEERMLIAQKREAQEKAQKAATLLRCLQQFHKDRYIHNRYFSLTFVDKLSLERCKSSQIL